MGPLLIIGGLAIAGRGILRNLTGGRGSILLAIGGISLAAGFVALLS
jgi:hypothetical protein